MVSFRLSDEQQMIKETVARFAREEMRPCAREADETETVPATLIDKGWELGLVQNHIPEEYGGFGTPRSAVTGAIVAEELAWGDLSLALHFLAPRLVAYPLLEAGTAEQKRQFLPRFCQEKFSAATAAVVEPRFDFDLHEIHTQATLREGQYFLNGLKCYVLLATQASLFLIYAAIDQEVAGFLVEEGTAGLSISEREKNMGLKALATAEVTLSDCRLPRESRLGGEKGCDFSRLMNFSRVGLAAMAVGVARAAFEYSRDYAKERRAFGAAIAQKQAIAFMLAEMATEIDATRLLTWEAAWRLDRGEETTREAYLAKKYAAGMALKVADNSVQILGGHGYIRDHPVEMWLRNARGFAMWEGLVII